MGFPSIFWLIINSIVQIWLFWTSGWICDPLPMLTIILMQRGTMMKIISPQRDFRWGNLKMHGKLVQSGEKKPILRKGTHANFQILGTRTCPGPDFSTTNNQIPAMRGVPDQTFGACRVVSTQRWGHVGNDPKKKNHASSNLYQKRSKHFISRRTRFLDMKPPSGQISFFVSDPKIIGNKLQTPKFVVTNINGLR